MIRPSPFSHWPCRRRALARISSSPTSEESSTHSGAAARRCEALEDLRPALLGDAALAQLLALDARLRGDEALRELGLRHLEREQRDGLVVLDRGVLGDVADERALAHRRTRGDDDQVAGLEAAGDLVEVLEARRGSGQRGALEREPVQLVELLVQHLLDRAEVLLAVVARDLEHRLLGLLDELARRRVVAEHALLDQVGAAQQPPQQRVLAHDLRVAPGVAGRGHDAGQFVDGRLAADLLQLAHLAQAVGDRQHVDRLALVVEREHRLVDHRVALAVEVLGAQPLLDHERVQRAVRQQDRAQHRLLGVEVVRRRDHPCGRPRSAVGCRGRAHPSGEFRLGSAPAPGPFPQIAREEVAAASTNRCSQRSRTERVRPPRASRGWSRSSISWRRPWS